MYLSWHKMHHDFKYTIALAHHWMTYKEALLFVLPQFVPPLLIGALRGRKVHLLALWGGMLFTQLNGILGHAGYRVPFIADWIPTFQAYFHDYHHVDYSANFAANFPFTDMMWGTFVHPKLETNMKKVMENIKAGASGYPKLP